MGLNKIQQKVRDVSDSEILISAGAGSGKTMVLTERVIRILDSYISKSKPNKGNITRLLILTFTNNAAKGMANKIKKAITEKLGKDPNNSQLKQQLEMIDSAYITTFDSFYNKLAKKYFYLLGIKKDFQIADSSLFQVQLIKYVDQEFENLYNQENKEFLDLLNKYTLKDDELIKNAVISIINGQSCLISGQLKLDDRVNNPFSNEFIDKLYNFLFEKGYKALKDYSDAIKLCQEDVIIDKPNDANKPIFELNDTYYSKYNECKEFDSIIDIYNKSKDFIKAKKEANITGWGKISMPKSTSNINKDKYNLAKDEFDNYIKSTANILSKQDFINLYNTNKIYYDFIYDIALKVNKKIEAFKIDNNQFTFSDIALKVTNLIETNPKVRKELQDSFDEIMVDEYQDNSDVQERLLKAIGNNNLFMVGDIKQSIYGFRGSEPGFFDRRYKEYKKEDNLNQAIDMNKNYRSTKQVLDTVNYIFRNLMVGYIDYSKDHMIESGNEDYCKMKNQLKPILINYQSNKKNDKGEPINFTGFEKAEIEIEIVARDIINRINSGEYIGFQEPRTFKDKNGNEKENPKYYLGHQISFKDFCILSRNTSNFSKIQDIFKKYNIPLKIEAEEDINLQQIVVIIRNLILLYCYIDLGYKKYLNEFKISLISVLRSPLFKMSNPDLIKTFLDENKPVNNFDDNEVVKKLKEINKTYKNMDIYFIFTKICKEFSLFNCIQDLYNPIVNLSNVENYFDVLKTMSKLHYSLEDVIFYFKNIKDKELESKVKISNSVEDAVTLCTIHKSKGLEYNIVYCMFNYTKFNMDQKKDKAKLFYTNQTGLYLPFVRSDKDDVSNLKNTKTPVDYYLRKINEQSTIEEEIRLFYVEITRPKLQYIFLNSKDYIKDKKEIKIKTEKPTDLFKCKSYSDLLLYSGYVFDDDATINYNLNDLNNKIKLNNIPDIEKIEASNIEITYCDIKPENINYKQFKKQEFNSSKITHQAKQIVEFGDKLHNILEVMSIKNPDLSIIKDEPSDVKKYILNFLNSDLVKKYKDYEEYHEYQYFDDELKSFGYIDLLLIGKDDFVIIDYKLKNLDDENYVRQLSNYYKTIKSKFNLEGKCYLYSLIDSKDKEIIPLND